MLKTMMHFIKHVVLVGTFIFMFVFTLKILEFAKLDVKIMCKACHTFGTYRGLRNLDNISLVLLEQRNNMSKLLNMQQQMTGQQECKEKHTSSKNGGFCEEQSKKDIHDEQLVPPLIQFLKGKYIGSFGDGPGKYKQLFVESDEVKGYDAFDGYPFCEVTSNGRVKFLDLALPQYGLPLYDWIMSLEVAEYIPRRFESIFIDNVVRHAREGVILSWARLGQTGYLHINNRPFEYVRDLMNSLGFSHDKDASELLKSAASLHFFKWNLNVYRRKKIISSEVLMLQT